MAAPFVFSYAHNDAIGDSFVEDFFNEVNNRVRKLTGRSDDGFIDEERIRTGEVWSERLATELRASPAIVCLYSPSYFLSKVCALELQVFLDRRLLYRRQNPGAGPPPGAIVPVLWQPTSIALSLPDFQFEKPKKKDLESDGVWRLRDRGLRSAFKDIAQSVASRVKEALREPLPDLGYEPVLLGLSSAFESPPLPPSDFDGPEATSGPQSATFVYPRTPAWSDWLYAPTHHPLLRIATAVAKGRELESRQLTFDTAAQDFAARVATARQRRNIVLLLIDGTTLSNQALVPRLREYDEESARTDTPGAAGVMVAWREGEGSTPSSRRLLQDVFPKMSLRQPPFFHASIERHDDFALAVGRTLDALRTAVRQAGTASPLVPSTPFATLPTIDGPGSRQAA